MHPIKLYNESVVNVPGGRVCAVPPFACKRFRNELNDIKSPEILHQVIHENLINAKEVGKFFAYLWKL